ncbi:ring finger and chy zinc finger domain protein 1 [Ichthyophthirius multifiliis]|uniref:Ring finger and chy zinc finger domain protein 1 n=1 Tax=Ichthyophthirius multifiliis TaxID=5932 RepID=G0QTK7_ICHMU|nr:ring finger and chy zinc finger domain protein 1 [Ichthyophthirius multifiliis]EGR31458.1 ring finger and chy zinc finger domain protein 1 [Ichthyophthirius multifiliis]|eukprot:XP_004034944.1 ring finger and chy zinc finger domain protein 1 [Ichthyophthirius multifiliis]
MDIEYNENRPCKHYLRGCSIQSPCCKLWYGCRLCHNELYNGPKGPGCLVEVMDRHNISLVRCNKCKFEQKPQQICENCQHVLGKYYCDNCKFFDSDPKKNIYHCEFCKMCRIGIKEDNFHCQKCNVCLPKAILDTHKCTQDGSDSTCPVQVICNIVYNNTPQLFIKDLRNSHMQYIYQKDTKLMLEILICLEKRNFDKYRYLNGFNAHEFRCINNKW